MSEERKFKVGDLVVIEGLKMITGYMHIEDGEMGVIVKVISDEESPAVFFFDYVIMVGGGPLHVFEQEIIKYIQPFSPCPSCECDPCDCSWGIK